MKVNLIKAVHLAPYPDLAVRYLRIQLNLSLRSRKIVTWLCPWRLSDKFNCETALIELLDQKLEQFIKDWEVIQSPGTPKNKI